MSLCSTQQRHTCCLLSYLKDAGSISTNICDSLQRMLAAQQTTAFWSCPCGIAYCTQMLRGKDKSECFVSFLHQKLSLKNGQMLCAWQTDLVSRKTSGKPHTLNTGVTSGSTRSFYDSHAVIQTLGLERCAANKNSYLQTLPQGTQSPVLLADSFCLKLYRARYS